MINTKLKGKKSFDTVPSNLSGLRLEKEVLGLAPPLPHCGRSIQKFPKQQFWIPLCKCLVHKVSSSLSTQNVGIHLKQ
jgi:hypothetical protein